jgi:hypothetical protein
MEWKNIEIISQPKDLKQPLIAFWKSQENNGAVRK